MHVEVIFDNQQHAVEIPEGWLTALEQITDRSVEMVLAVSANDDTPLHHLGHLEVTLVDDKTSDRVHRDFMGIDGATDVITFHHGEIVIGAEVAMRQAEDHHEPLLREIYRYFIHGLLHLAGYEDEADEDRAAMESAQETIVAQGWETGLGKRN